MKSTIKLTTNKALIVQQCKGGGVTIELACRFNYMEGPQAFHLTQDQCGALLFAIEQAAEAAQIAQDRATASA